MGGVIKFSFNNYERILPLKKILTAHYKYVAVVQKCSNLQLAGVQRGGWGELNLSAKCKESAKREHWDKCGPFLDTQICVEVFVELFACTSKITFSSFFILPLPDIPRFS